MSMTICERERDLLKRQNIELREATNGLSGALQLASRQVEVLLVRIDKMASDASEDDGSDTCCNTCPSKDYGCGRTCIESLRKWSLEQAKGGGGE